MTQLDTRLDTIQRELDAIRREQGGTTPAPTPGPTPTPGPQPTPQPGTYTLDIPAGSKEVSLADASDIWGDWSLTLRARFGDLSEGRHVLARIEPRTKTAWPMVHEFKSPTNTIVGDQDGESVPGRGNGALGGREVELLYRCAGGVLTLSVDGAVVATDERAAASRGGMKGGVVRIGPTARNVSKQNYADTDVEVLGGRLVVGV